MTKKTFEIDLTPDWHGVYRWLMHVKKHNKADYNHLVNNSGGEFEKLIKLAEEKGWDRGDNGV